MRQATGNGNSVLRMAASLGALLALTVALAVPAPASAYIDFEPSPEAYQEPPPADENAPPASCTASHFIETPFLAFEDDRDYVLAPGGDFESTPEGWSLTGGAGIAYGNEPWYVHGPEDTNSLDIPKGSSVESAPMCIDLDYPTFRLFVRRATRTDDAHLRVDVIYLDAEGAPEQTVGWLTTGKSWEVTPDVPLLPELGGEEPGDRHVAFRLTAEGAGGYRIDDLYVDPRGRR